MKKKQLFILHILYWLYFFIGVELVNGLIFDRTSLHFPLFWAPMALSGYVLFMATFYANYVFILPYCLKAKKYISAILLWTALLALFILVRYFVQEYLFLRYMGQCNLCGISASAYIARNFLQSFNYLILPSTLIWFVDHWLKIEKQKSALLQEKLATERAFLQSQVNPHFLYNTLNNIYSMVFHQSVHALPAIQKLSGIMRYALKEGTSDWIPLATESSYLRSYIELQKYRVKNPAIDYQETGDFSSINVPPMLFISFVENAFKHGVLNDPAHPIQLHIIAENKKLIFEVKNKINTYLKDASSGVGLSSVKKRLEVYYAGHYQLLIHHDALFYSSKLIIDY